MQFCKCRFMSMSLIYICDREGIELIMGYIEGIARDLVVLCRIA